MYSFISDLHGSDEYKCDDRRIAGYVKNVFGWILGIKEDESSRCKIFENGLNGYKFAVGMPLRAGVVHVGHASGTVLVTVTGQGAMMASPGWEYRLYRFLTDVKGWLTRIDMAFDDYEGIYFPVRVMREKAKEGAFQRGGRPPKIELRGSWEQDDPMNSGLTLYVGSRMSGKFTRIYEKGKQLGSEDSPWVRAEVELHNSCYQLTLNMLLSPTGWFVAFYPCFEVIQTVGNREELEYRKRISVHTLEHSIKWIRHQAGGHLAAIRQFYSDAELLDMLVRPESIPEAFLQANEACKNLKAPSVSLTDEPGWIEAGV
jgi:phage replication initiation protein